MTKLPRKFDHDEAADATQAIWTGLILAGVVFIASFLHFASKRTGMVSNAPAAIEMPRTSGSIGGTTGCALHRADVLATEIT
jgi:hypothetical protein